MEAQKCVNRLALKRGRLPGRYGCEIIAEKVDFLSRPKSAESENPGLVDRDDGIPF